MTKEELGLAIGAALTAGPHREVHVTWDILKEIFTAPDPDMLAIGVFAQHIHERETGRAIRAIDNEAVSANQRFYRWLEANGWDGVTDFVKQEVRIRAATSRARPKARS